MNVQYEYPECEYLREDRVCDNYGHATQPVWCQLCQKKPAYREAYEQGRGPGQGRPVNLIQLPTGGPGTELTKIIANWQRMLPWFDLSAQKGCTCKATAKWMDRQGCDGCVKNIDKVLDKLEKEAERRNLTVPFLRFMAKRMVKQAIRRAR